MHTETLSECQKNAYNALSAALCGRNAALATLEGYAGTGKTTLTATLVRAWLSKGYQVLVTAPTHKALGVLQSKIGECGAEYKTIHAALGLRLVNSMDGTSRLQKHRLPVMAEYDIVIVDEASMLSAGIFSTIVATSKQAGVGVLFVGDPAQLLPVTENEQESSPAFSDQIPLRVRLRKIMRQAQKNPILRWSEFLRENIEANTLPNMGALAFGLGRDDQSLCQIVHGDGSLLHDWCADAHKYGLDTRVLAFTNQAVMRHNQAVHDRLFPNSLPYAVGEPLIVGDALETAQGKRIPNGMMLTIVRVNEQPHEVHGFHAVKVLAEGDGFVVELDLPFEPDKVQREIASRFAMVRHKTDPEEKSTWSRAAYALKQALPDVRHAYAMTVHKSQGSTFDTVLVDWRDMQKARLQPGEIARLLYVAITRAAKFCVIVQ